MKFIVGLGNPGIAYKRTRHNIGFMVVDAFCKKKNLEFTKRSRFKAYEATGPDIVVVKPLTYMNLSGQSVQSVMHFYKARLEDMLVICDDIALPFGQLRLKAAGSSGGQKGLKDIEQCLQSQSWPRLRVGIGEPPLGQALEDYVLGSFSGLENESLAAIIEKAVEAIELWITQGVSKAMNQVNKPS